MYVYENGLWSLEIDELKKVRLSYDWLATTKIVVHSRDKISAEDFADIPRDIQLWIIEKFYAIFNAVVELSTNTCPITFVAIYGTILDDYFEAELDELNEVETEYFRRNYNDKPYKNAVRDSAAYVLKEQIELLQDILPSLELVHTGDIHSPKEYNFSNDVLWFDVSINLVELSSTIVNFDLETRVEFQSYLKDNFTSCDWFISYTANDIFWILAGIAKGNSQEVWAAIYFIAKKLYDDGNEYESYDWSIAYTVWENVEINYCDCLEDGIEIQFPSVTLENMSYNYDIKEYETDMKDIQDNIDTIREELWDNYEEELDDFVKEINKEALEIFTKHSNV